MADWLEGVGTPFQQFLGARWRYNEDEDGSVDIELDVRDEMRGPVGTLEGGIIATLADVAGASAVAKASGRMVATEHLSISYLAPGREGPVRATGVPIRIGRHDGVAEVRIVDKGRDDRLMAVAILTLRLLDEMESYAYGDQQSR